MNSALATYLYNGRVLNNIQNVSITPEAVESTRMRGINPSRKAFGWRHGQVPGVDLSFETVIEEAGPEIDWNQLKALKTEFAFAEQSATWTRTLIKCVVQQVTSATDENGAVTLTVNVGALYEVWS